MKLEELQKTIETMSGDYTWKTIQKKNLNFVTSGSRGRHEFIVRPNMRTLRSGPHKGKIRVDGALIVMLGNKQKDVVRTAIVRKSSNLFRTLDDLVTRLLVIGN